MKNIRLLWRNSQSYPAECIFFVFMRIFVKCSNPHGAGMPLMEVGGIMHRPGGYIDLSPPTGLLLFFLFFDNSADSFTATYATIICTTSAAYLITTSTERSTLIFFRFWCCFASPFTYLINANGKFSGAKWLRGSGKRDW